MSEFTHVTTFRVHDCAECGIIFAIPDSYDKRRADDGKTFYCPNQHRMSYPGILPRKELKITLDEANQRIAELNSDRATLIGRLDQAEAMMAENGLLEDKNAPPAAPPPAPRDET